MGQYAWENEWRLQELKENSFIAKHAMDKTAKWVKLVESKVPDTLQSTLEAAFNKAFVAVFEKGGALIEKTYNKDKQERIFKENEKELNIELFNPKSIKRFERQAKRTVLKNLSITTAEGVGLGVFGVGLPDIPLFVSVLLKSIYEIAISYGFSYTADQEKLFILKIIDTSLQSGEGLKNKNQEINQLIYSYDMEKSGDCHMDKMNEFVTELQIIRQIDHSAQALSNELLYGKFVQSMTFVGVIGGTADVTCLKRVTDYAALKYRRRFLLQQKPQMD